MHPYKNLPPRQFWSRAVAQNFSTSEVGTFPKPLIRHDDKIATAGSCFAANLVPYLERNGFSYIRTEYQHSIFAGRPAETMSYAKYSAAYGNVYTARQLHQLLLRALGRFKPQEDRWLVDGTVIDPFRPGMRYVARSEREFDVLAAQHLRAVRQVFETCDVFIFTLGLTEAWVSALDGAVFPACPGTIAGTFDPQRHQFVNFTAEEVTSDLNGFVRDLREINPRVRVILTVSPVPLVATATDQHVLAATTYSKAVLRVAAETAARRNDNVYYFPSYEIVTGPQAPEDFFEADRRDVSKKALEAVMAGFLANCDTAKGGIALDLPKPKPRRGAAAQAISARIIDIECEEAAQDR